MPTMQDISLQDFSTGSAVARLFKPNSRDIGGKAEWRTAHQAARSANHRFTVEYKEANLNAKKSNDVVVISFYVPTMETLGTADNGFTPPATVKETDWARLELHFPRDSTVNRRMTIRNYIAGVLGAGGIIDVIENGNKITG